MHRYRRALLLSSLVCSVVAMAQVGQTSGAIRGIVSLKKGAFASGAKIMIRNTESGFTKTATADELGSFLIPFVPLGPYDVTVTMPAMRTAKGRVQVYLGQTADLTFDLDEQVATTTVEVIAESAAVDSTQINSMSAISQELVEAVPINGRNFTDLVLMTPGASENSQGYRQTVEGARGIMNNLQIDGASYNSKFNGEQRGGTRIPFSFGQDTIRELQVINNAFDAQYGDASGAVINAVTKSGTNEIQGGAMILFRPDSLVADIKPVPYDPYGTTNRADALKRKFQQEQFAFHIGGPIIKDTLHYFVSAETMRFRLDSVPVVNFNSADGSESSFSTFWKNMGSTLISSNSGQTMLQESTKPWTNDLRNLVVFARLDWTINANHRLTLRMNSQTYTGKNDVWNRQMRSDKAESNNSQNKYDSLSTVLEMNSVLRDNLFNEARIQFATEKRPTTPNTVGISEIVVPGYTVGQNNLDPRTTDESSKQLIDNLTYLTGDWTFKGGIDLQWIDFTNTFLRNRNGSWNFRNWDAANQWWNGSFPGSLPTITYYQNYSVFDGTITFKEKLFAGYLQTQYAGLFSRRLLLNLGIRYTKEMWDGNPSPNPRVQGLDQMPDNSVVDPRFGFSFDVFGNSKTVIRGGYGWFSTSNVGQNVSSAITENGKNTMPFQVQLNSSTQALFSEGGALSKQSRVQNNRMTGLDNTSLLTMPMGSLVLSLIDPDAKMAQSRTTTLGVEHDFGKGFTLGVRGTYKQFKNFQYWVNINMAQYNPSTNAVDPNAYYNDGYTYQYNKFSRSTRPGRAMVRGRMLDLAGFGDVGLSKYDGEGSYRALIIEANRHSKDGLGFKASLTFAKAQDNNSNERSTFSGSSAFANTYNPADPGSCVTLSDNDQAFRGVVSLYLPRYYGFKLSGQFSYTTGRPLTPRYYADINGDGAYNDPVFDMGGRNSMRQPYRKTFDMKLTRGFKVKSLWLEGIVEVFNVFNWANQYTSYTTIDTSSGQPSVNFRQINEPDTRTREIQFTFKVKF